MNVPQAASTADTALSEMAADYQHVLRRASSAAYQNPHCGTLNVFCLSGGVVSALTINDPNDPTVKEKAQRVQSGGYVDGIGLKIDGGTVILGCWARSSNHMPSFIHH